MKIRGKCSWFGGPDDVGHGITASEDLAFIYDKSDQPDLFLPEAPPGVTGLAGQLDPDEFYVACRWPYNSETKAKWREALLARKALVRNPKNGKHAWAFPADWGPADEETGGRVADLSPSLLNFLGLTTDDEVQVYFPTRQVTIPLPPDTDDNALAYPSIVISAGHGLHIRGAAGPEPWGLDEVDSARKVVTALVESLQDNGVKVVKYFDDVSTTQNENLERICANHNAVEGRDLDISVHFNAYENQTDRAMGCEVFAISQMELAAEISGAMAEALDLPDRGAKDGSGLYFCNHTEVGSILIEVAFCDAKIDCDAFREKFDVLIDAISDVLLTGNAPTA